MQSIFRICLQVSLHPVRARDRFREDLKENGIQTTWYPALHKFTEYRRFAPADGLPIATEAADRHCALPLSSLMDEAAVETVVDVVRAVVSRLG